LFTFAVSCLTRTTIYTAQGWNWYERGSSCTPNYTLIDVSPYPLRDSDKIRTVQRHSNTNT